MHFGTALLRQAECRLGGPFGLLGAIRCQQDPGREDAHVLLPHRSLGFPPKPNDATERTLASTLGRFHRTSLSPRMRRTFLRYMSPATMESPNPAWNTISPTTVPGLSTRSAI